MYHSEPVLIFARIGMKAKRLKFHFEQICSEHGGNFVPIDCRVSVIFHVAKAVFTADFFHVSRSSAYFLRYRKNLGKTSALQSDGGIWTKIVFAEVRGLTHSHT